MSFKKIIFLFLLALSISGCISGMKGEMLNSDGKSINPPENGSTKLQGVPFHLLKPTYSVTPSEVTTGKPADGYTYAVTVDYDHPDPKHRYTMNIDPAILSEVAFSPTYNKKGGLSTTVLNIDSRVDEAIAQIATLTGQIAALASGLPLPIGAGDKGNFQNLSNRVGQVSGDSLVAYILDEFGPYFESDNAEIYLRKFIPISEDCYNLGFYRIGISDPRKGEFKIADPCYKKAWTETVKPRLKTYRNADPKFLANYYVRSSYEYDWLNTVREVSRIISKDFKVSTLPSDLSAFENQLKSFEVEIVEAIDKLAEAEAAVGKAKENVEFANSDAELKKAKAELKSKKGELRKAQGELVEVEDRVGKRYEVKIPGKRKSADRWAARHWKKIDDELKRKNQSVNPFTSMTNSFRKEKFGIEPSEFKEISDKILKTMEEASKIFNGKPDVAKKEADYKEALWSFNAINVDTLASSSRIKNYLMNIVTAIDNENTAAIDSQKKQYEVELKTLPEILLLTDLFDAARSYIVSIEDFNEAKREYDRLQVEGKTIVASLSGKKVEIGSKKESAIVLGKRYKKKIITALESSPPNEANLMGIKSEYDKVIKESPHFLTQLKPLLKTAVKSVKRIGQAQKLITLLNPILDMDPKVWRNKQIKFLDELIADFDRQLALMRKIKDKESDQLIAYREKLRKDLLLERARLLDLEFEFEQLAQLKEAVKDLPKKTTANANGVTTRLDMETYKSIQEEISKITIKLKNLPENQESQQGAGVAPPINVTAAVSSKAISAGDIGSPAATVTGSAENDSKKTITLNERDPINLKDTRKKIAVVKYIPPMKKDKRNRCVQVIKRMAKAKKEETPLYVIFLERLGDASQIDNCWHEEN